MRAEIAGGALSSAVIAGRARRPAAPPPAAAPSPIAAGTEAAATLTPAAAAARRPSGAAPLPRPPRTVGRELAAGRTMAHPAQGIRAWSLAVRGRNPPVPIVIVDRWRREVPRRSLQAPRRPSVGNHTSPAAAPRRRPLPTDRTAPARRRNAAARRRRAVTGSPTPARPPSTTARIPRLP